MFKDVYLKYAIEAAAVYENIPCATDYSVWS